MDPRDKKIEALRAEISSLSRSGADAVHAYSRKKERCDELMESLIDLQARYDAMAAQTQATNTESALSASPSSLEARVEELELALAAKDDILRGLQLACAQKDAALLEVMRKQEAAAAAAAADAAKVDQEANNTQHQQVMGLVEHAFELLESHSTTATVPAVAAASSIPPPSPPPSSSTSTTTASKSNDLNLTECGTQVGTPAMDKYPERQACSDATIQSLLDDLALVKDFAGIELAVTTAALQEMQQEGLEREKALSEEIGGMKEELGRVQAMIAAVRAEAEEQARKDSQAIQELEVTVQLTEGALLLAKQQQEQAAAAAASAAVLPEGALSPLSTAKLQGVMAGLRSQLQDTERKAQEAEVGRVRLMQELEGMENRLEKAEESLAAAAAAAATAAAAAATAAAESTPVKEPGTATAAEEGLGDIFTPAKGRAIMSSTSTSMTPRTPAPTAAAAAAAAAASTPSSSTVAMQTTAALRRLQAELLQTKAQLDTANTNTSLLQRYIATRRLQTTDELAASVAAPVTSAPGEGGEKGREGLGRPAAELCASPAPSSASNKSRGRLLFSPPPSAPAASAGSATATNGCDRATDAPSPSTSSAGMSSLFSFEKAANFFSLASSSAAAAAAVAAVAVAAPAGDETNEGI